MHEVFNRIARHVSSAAGSPWAFAIAFGTIIVWAITGPIFGFSDTWQLVINTGTTIVTFLMVFLIQNTQNRDSRALHLKLDEVIRSMEGARNEIIDMEDATDEDLEKLQKDFEKLRAEGGTGSGAVLDAIHQERQRRGSSKKKRPAAKSKKK
jgi:low affinity Fe/Cu permease